VASDFAILKVVGCGELVGGVYLWACQRVVVGFRTLRFLKRVRGGYPVFGESTCEFIRSNYF